MYQVTIRNSICIESIENFKKYIDAKEYAKKEVAERFVNESQAKIHNFKNGKEIARYINRKGKAVLVMISI